MGKRQWAIVWIILWLVVSVNGISKGTTHMQTLVTGFSVDHVRVSDA